MKVNLSLNVGGLLHESACWVVSRGVWRGSNGDRLPVIIKTHKAEYPSSRELSKLKHEYHLMRGLSVDGVVRAYSLVPFGNGCALILEDFNGTTLRELIRERKLEFEQMLRLSVRLAGIVGEIHKARVIHKDLKPENLMVSPDTEEAKITDFCNATRLSAESPRLVPFETPEGTLPYMSPEQTGRTNRLLDCRSDLYSLGVVYYEMFCGRLPFECGNREDLIHCHLATRPTAPCDVNPALPPLLSDIIMKLMSKAAEERYQSAGGLRADLAACMSQWKSCERRSISVGRYDVSEVLRLSQRLYGRDAELEALGRASRCVHSGESRLTLVVGSAGVGKSSLVQEYGATWLASGGRFCSGKYDRLKPGIPYGAIVQAFGELFDQLLAQSQREIDECRSRLRKATGENGRIITDLFPEAVHIIGDQPPLEKLPATQSQKRFVLVLRRFVAALCSAEKPLLIFLDDLQWCDGASLRLLEALLGSEGIGYLHVVAAYRDNEIGTCHPLQGIVERICQRSGALDVVVVNRLGEEHVRSMTADVLQRAGSDDVDVLSRLLYKKTLGNPFFVNQLLKSLYRQGLIYLDESERRWRCDLVGIEQAPVADDVAALVADRIGSFSLSTREVLSVAACAGNTFDLRIVSRVCDRSVNETGLALAQAAADGYVIPLDDNSAFVLDGEEEFAAEDQIRFRFLHDWLQRVAHSLLDESREQQVHERTGRAFLEGLTAQEREKAICEVADHLNRARVSLVRRSARLALCRLNLEAAGRADVCLAHESTLSYALTGIELLPDSIEAIDHELCRDLLVHAARAACSCGKHELVESLTERIARTGRTPIEKAAGYEIRIESLFLQDRLKEAIQTMSLALRPLGIFLPKRARKLRTLLSFGLVWLLLRRRGIESLAGKPVTQRADVEARVAGIYFAFMLKWKSPLRSALEPSLGTLHRALALGNTQFAAMMIRVYCTSLFFCGTNLDRLDHQLRFVGRELQSPGEANQLHHLAIIRQAALNLMGRGTYRVRLVGDAFDEDTVLPQLPEAAAEEVLWGVHFLKCVLSCLFGCPEEASSDFEPTTMHADRGGRIGFAAEVLPYLSLIMLARYSDIDPSRRRQYVRKVDAYQRFMKSQARRAPTNYLHKWQLVEAERARVIHDIPRAMEYYDLAIEGARKNEYIHEQALAAELCSRFYLELGRRRVASTYLLDARDCYLSWGALAKVTQIDERYGGLMEASRRSLSVEGAGHESTTTDENPPGIDAVAKATRLLSSEIDLEKLIEKIMRITVEVSGAQQGLLLLEQDGAYYIEAESTDEKSPVRLMDHEEAKRSGKLACSVLDCVARGGAGVVVHNATEDRRFSGDQYVRRMGTKSILCAPMCYQGRVRGAVYLENNLTANAFGPACRNVVELLCSQAAVSLENALLYRSLLEDRDRMRRTEEELRRSEQTARALLNAPTDAALLIDTNGIIIEGNETFAGRYGRRPEELVGTCIWELQSPDVAARRRAVVREVAATGVPRRFEDQADDQWSDNVIYPVLDETGTVISIAVLARDITARKKAEEQVRQRDELLVQSGKLVSMGTMAAGIAHEISNPNQAILLNASYLCDASADVLRALETGERSDDFVIGGLAFSTFCERFPALVDGIHSCAQRIQSIINELKAYARGETNFETESVDVNVVVQAAVMLAGNMIKKATDSFVLNLQEDLPAVTGNSQRLEQVFLNLVQNGCQALKSRDRSLRVSTSYDARCRNILIQIADEGVGMTSQQLARIKEPFYSTRSAEGGLGLGLYVSATIINEHLGTLRFASQKEKGTVATVTLPAEKTVALQSAG